MQLWNLAPILFGCICWIRLNEKCELSVFLKIFQAANIFSRLSEVKTSLKSSERWSYTMFMAVKFCAVKWRGEEVSKFYDFFMSLVCASSNSIVIFFWGVEMCLNSTQWKEKRRNENSYSTKLIQTCHKNLIKRTKSTRDASWKTYQPKQ